ALSTAPEPVTGVNAVQVPSGVAVSPERTLNETAVPAGVSLVHDALVQVPGPPPSKVRESKVPEYGVIRTESIETAAPPATASLAIGRIGVVIVTALATWSVPSTKYEKLPSGLQSI